MTDAEAGTLRRGDRIQLRATAGNPHIQHGFFVVRHIAEVAGEVRIITMEDFRFIPWEVEHSEPEVHR